MVGVYTGFYWMPINYFLGIEPWRVFGIPIDTQAALIIVGTVLLVIGYYFDAIIYSEYNIQLLRVLK